jgi:hypothetical protein
LSKKLNVILVSGPRCGGKSTLVRLIASKVCSRPPHYLRLVSLEREDSPRLTLLGDLKSAGLASWKRLNYDAEHVFEILPDCLNEIGRTDAPGTVLIEADGDPSLRYAFPYDHRIFVMPSPGTVDEVFRSPDQAATALKEVMDDTAAFASEIFGLFGPDPDTDEGVTFQRTAGARGAVEERLDITSTQMRRFMMTPVGAEIASRIQLQPAYHSLMESDLILVNMAVGDTTDIVDLCIKRIQMLIARLGEGRLDRPVMLNCDPLDGTDPLQKQLLKKLGSLITT